MGGKTTKNNSNSTHKLTQSSVSFTIPCFELQQYIHELYHCWGGRTGTEISFLSIFTLCFLSSLDWLLPTETFLSFLWPRKQHIYTHHISSKKKFPRSLFLIHTVTSPPLSCTHTFSSSPSQFISLRFTTLKLNNNTLTLSLTLTLQSWLFSLPHMIIPSFTLISFSTTNNFLSTILLFTITHQGREELFHLFSS